MKWKAKGIITVIGIVYVIASVVSSVIQSI